MVPIDSVTPKREEAIHTREMILVLNPNLDFCCVDTYRASPMDVAIRKRCVHVASDNLEHYCFGLYYSIHLDLAVHVL